MLDSVDAAVGYVLQFDATPYLHDPQIEKLEKVFADPRIAAFLRTTDDPQVQGVLTPVSVN